jgi:SynChlorMet cassette radical SAM/SPASM protein ScmF
VTVCDPALPGEEELERGSSSRPAAEQLDLPEGVPPLRAFYLYLTAGCNLACRHCWVVPRYVDGEPDPGEVMDLDDLRAAVAEARPLGLATCKLTGGEPTLHPRFREIVELLSAEGLGLDMESNGTLLTAELARFLKDESSVGFISISLDAPTAAAHDAFRGVPGAYDAALRGLGHLVDAGYENVQLIMSVWRGNRDEVEAVVRLAEERGAASVKLNPVTATGRGGQMHERGESLGFDETLALARHVDEEVRPGATVGVVLNLPPALVPAADLWRTRGRVGDCGAQRILGLVGTGDIALCGIGRTIPELTYGRLGVDSIRDVWLSHPRILELRGQLADREGYPGICADCIHGSGCRTGCVANNFERGGRLVWPNVLCEEAERRGVFPATRRRGYDRERGIGGDEDG